MGPDGCNRVIFIKKIKILLNLFSLTLDRCPLKMYCDYIMECIYFLECIASR